MFGPPKHLRRLAEALDRSCPLWDARIMDFGGELAVVINTSERTRSLSLVRGGVWQTLNVILDDEGNPVPGGPGVVATRQTPDRWEMMHRIIVAAQVDAYRNALTIPHGDPTQFMRDAAEKALPYLTAGGR